MFLYPLIFLCTRSFVRSNIYELPCHERCFMRPVPYCDSSCLTSFARSSDDPTLEPADLFVTANTYELIGFVGKAVTMYATVRGDPRPTEDNITWLKMAGLLPVGRVIITYDLATNESRLRITDMIPEDSGSYVCMANVNGVIKSVDMQLKVVVEPRVERVSGLISSKAVGQTVTFSVTVGGDPMPQPEDINWAKIDSRGLPVSISHTRQTTGDGNKELVVDTLEISDEGWYKCLVITDEGRADAAFLLHVLGMRSIQETAVGVVGNSVTMTCIATFFDMMASSPDITWYRYDDPITPITSSSITSKDSTNHAISELVLSDLDWSDEGDYFCTSSYPNYPDHSIYNATLSVRGVSSSPAKGTAVLGRSVIFQCEATGDIQATWTWQRNGVVITGESADTFENPLSSTTFTYTGVVRDDENSQFTCIAEFDGLSHESQPASVTVLGVTSHPSPVYGVVGGSASLSCEADGTPDSFAWLQDSQKILGDSHTVTSITPSNSQILVEDLSRSDDGDYTCVPIYAPDNLLFSGGNTTSAPGKLSVIGLTQPPIQTIVKVGDTATFTCKANAVPMPTLTWYKDGGTRSTGVSSPVTVAGERVSYLTIQYVGDEDVAAYTCKAEYPALGAHLSEGAALKFRGIEEEPLVTDVVLGYSSQLNCTGRGEAEADMKWYSNGTEMTKSDVFDIITASNLDVLQDQELIDTRTILTVSEVTMDLTYLQIVCRATWMAYGAASTVDSQTVRFNPLYVYNSPDQKIAVRYTKVELECSATGNPLIRWDRSGRTYGVGIIDMEGEDLTHSTLIIGNVTEADQGKIWCVAQYDEGVYNSDKATLTVVGIVTEPQTVTISQRGQSVQFTCVVDRYPINTVVWYKGESRVQGYENRKNMTIVTKDLTVEYLLRVTSVTEEDMGDYYCKAEYPQGNQISQPAYLIIEEQAQIILIVATGGQKAGDSIELLCQATGVPKPTITWRRSGKPFPDDSTSSVVTIYKEPGSSLVLINSTSTSDQGVYSCVASNGIGDPVIEETELIVESAVKVVTVASASSLLVFIIAVCTAVMLFALYRRRKRKRLHPKNDVQKIQPPSDEDVENHVYDNEASIFGDVKSCDDDDMDYESIKMDRIFTNDHIISSHSRSNHHFSNPKISGGIECDDDIPTVEPPVDNPALFLMPDRTSKELPPLNRLPSGQPLSQHPMFVSTIATRKNQLPSLASSGTLPPLLQDIYQTEAQLNSSQSSDIPGCHTGLIIEEEDETLGLVPEINDGSSPCLSDYNSCTDLTSSGGLPSAYNQMFPEVKVEPTRRVSLLAREKLRRESPDPHVPSNIG